MCPLKSIMNKIILFLIFSFLNIKCFYAFQIINYTSSPIFESCKSYKGDALKQCFDSHLNELINAHFKMSSDLEGYYQGEVKILFEVTDKGLFKMLHVSADEWSLKTAASDMFESFPRVTPVTYNGKPTYSQYSVSLKLPLPSNSEKQIKVFTPPTIAESSKSDSDEYDVVNEQLIPYKYPEYHSNLQIPFSHDIYSKFDAAMNAIGTNTHTASKPYVYQEVSNYYDFWNSYNHSKYSSNKWFSWKLWNEHLVQLQSEKYWFTLDPIIDLALGHDTNADFKYTYNNTRGFNVQGGLGSKLSFSTTLYESQGRFAQYFNDYAISIKGVDSHAVIPGRGISKPFGTNAFDYPVSEAYLSYTPADFMDIQFGYGKNFIGDGYRSLLQSDVASPSTYLKLNTKFWKIKYTNNWMWLKDIRPEVQLNKSYLSKYMANHFLSLNISKRLNLGLFESVIWSNSNGEGFKLDYLNPFIFLRTIEFQNGQDAGNALMGLTFKYKVNNSVNIYGQYIIDEFSTSDVFAGNQSWKNKFGYQLGVKYYNAFKVDNLLVQLEYNQVRPYTYSQGGDGNLIETNYGHTNQSMAHLWSANFRETIFISRYNYDRWYGAFKIIYGVRGMDFNTSEDNFSYGGDLYKSYNDRPYDAGVKIGQGNKTSTLLTDLHIGYTVNTATNLKVFSSIVYRNYNPEINTSSNFDTNTLWINFGLRTDLFNWYFDY